MTDKKTEALKLALEAISALLYNDMNRVEIAMNAIAALRQALEQPSDSVEQKPVVLNQFLSDVMTAAGLVKHGKQSKALAARLQVEVMKLHTALRAALEQPEQEPFGYFHYDLGLELWQETGTGDGKPLYAAPPKQPEQEPATLESIYEIIIHWDEGGGKRSRRELARRITELYTAPPEARQDKA